MNLYPFGKAATNIYVHLLFNIKYEGLENIPNWGGFILSCNHQSFYDPLFIAYKIKKPINFMARSEFFKSKLVGWLFRSLGAFPVQRGKSDRSAMTQAKEFIDNGNVLALFPEGTRSKDGNPARPKPGVAMIAGMVGCGVLPVGISYKGKLTFRKKVTVRYGALITPEMLAIDTGSTATIRNASYMVMNAIVANMDKDCYTHYGSVLADGGKGDAG